MPGVYDRLVVNFSTKKGLELAARFRKVCGYRGVNSTLIKLIERYIQEQESKK